MPRRPLDAEVSKARREAEEAAAVARGAEAKLQALLRAQQELFAAIGEEHRDSLLRNEHESSSIIDTMNTEITVPGARLETKHPGAKAIRRVDGSIAKFADKHKLKHTTVRSWYAAGEAAREIPKKWADLLVKAPYEVPLSAWKNGIGP